MTSNSLKHERQRLAHVPDDDLQLGMRVENPADNHPEHMQRRLDVPAPSGARHHLADHWLKAAEPGVDHRLGRLRRMEVDRQLQRFRPRQDRPEEAVVEIASAPMAVDDDALKSMLADRALEFRDRCRRVGDRQRRQAEQPRRMAPDGFRERGVRASRERLCLFDIELFDAGRGQRKRLHGHAGGVHRRDAALADIDKVSDELRKAPADLLRALLQPTGGAVEECKGGKVLFKGDRAHWAPLREDGEDQRPARHSRLNFC